MARIKPLIIFVFSIIVCCCSIVQGQEGGVFVLGGEGSDELQCLTGRDSVMYGVGGFQQNIEIGNTVLTAKGGLDVFVFCKNAYTEKVLWATALGSTANDAANDAEADAQLNLYCVGHYNKQLYEQEQTVVFTDNPAVFVAKYNAKGKRLWAKNIGASGGIIVRDLCVAADGKWYLTGSFQDTLNIDNKKLVSIKGRNTFFVLCCDSNGKLLWATQPHWALGQQTEGRALATDDKGNVWLGGNFSGKLAVLPQDTLWANPVYTDIFFAKLNHKGQWQWAKQFKGVYHDACRKLLLTKDNQLFMSGELTGVLQLDSIKLQTAFTFSDVFVCKLNTDGKVLGARQSLGNGEVSVEAMQWNGEQLVVAGYFKSDFWWQDSTYWSKGVADAFELRLDANLKPMQTEITGSAGNDLLRCLWCDGRRRWWRGGAFQKEVLWGGYKCVAKGNWDGVLYWGR